MDSSGSAPDDGAKDIASCSPSHVTPTTGMTRAATGPSSSSTRPEVSIVPLSAMGLDLTSSSSSLGSAQNMPKAIISTPSCSTANTVKARLNHNENRTGISNHPGVATFSSLSDSAMAISTSTAPVTSTSSSQPVQTSSSNIPIATTSLCIDGNTVVFQKDMLQKNTVVQLKEFLRRRKKKCTGTKPELIRLVNIYFDLPEVTAFVEEDAGPQMDCSGLAWIGVKADKDCSKVPKGFNIEVINLYLTESIVAVAAEDEEAENEGLVDVGTKKPAVKGRKLYLSERIHLVELAQKDSGTLFLRANVQASMRKNLFRYPCVSIKANGSIESSMCSCEQNADGRCAHVAALLYYVEDLSMGCPRMSKPCTSKTQSWGKGQVTSKDPMPIHVNQYSKKRKADRLFAFDPRDQHLQNTSEEEARNLLFKIESLHSDTMWEKLLSYTYEDYSLGEEQLSVLKASVAEMEKMLARDTVAFQADEKSSVISVHVSKTEDQSSSLLWHSVRSGKVTASAFKQFVTNPAAVAEKQWDPKTDLSNVPAIRWGLENEHKARICFEGATGESVESCGFFISCQYPFMGCSPDGLLKNSGLIEIKCPFLLRDKKPTQIDQLSKSQRTAFCCRLDDEGKLKLKENHGYYYQIQFQLFVTGRSFCKFFI